MSLIKRPHGVKFKEPERFSPAEARERRLTALLEREQRFAEVPNFQRKIEAARSQAQYERVHSLAKAIVDEPEKRVHKAASIAAALSQFKERDFANPQARAAYRKLRAAQEALNDRRGSSRNVSPSGGNKSFFNPTGKDFASTIAGTAARLSGWTQLGESWTRSFLDRSRVLPCIQRSVRREVMFAKKYAGKGYRVRHRRSWASGIPC